MVTISPIGCWFKLVTWSLCGGSPHPYRDCTNGRTTMALCSTVFCGSTMVIWDILFPVHSTQKSKTAQKKSTLAFLLPQQATKMELLWLSTTYTLRLHRINHSSRGKRSTQGSLPLALLPPSVFLFP